MGRLGFHEGHARADPNRNNLLDVRAKRSAIQRAGVQTRKAHLP
jgi:hypothetical protein